MVLIAATGSWRCEATIAVTLAPIYASPMPAGRSDVIRRARLARSR
jgi:hypothetical protein